MAVLLLSAGWGGAGAQTPPPSPPPQGQRLPALTLQAGMHLIRAEVAQTAEQRAIGLMNRRDLAVNDGMLFVFEQPDRQCFWMKNTPTPLDIAFVADDGRIVNLDQMQPFSEAAHCSAGPVRYVLEMNRGWFSRRGIQPGQRLQGAPFSAAAKASSKAPSQQTR